MRPLVPAVAVLVALIVPRPLAAREIEALADLGPRVRGILGDEAADLVVRARRAEVYRLEEIRPGTPPALKPGAMAVSGYPVAGKGRALDAVLLAAFRAALLDGGTYTHYDLPPHTGVGKMCGGFRPGVAVRFWGERGGKPRHVDALLCFHCHDVALVSDEPGAKVVAHDMHAGGPLLLRLASAAIPEDRFLADRLAQAQEERARDLLFESMLPSHAQATLSALELGSPESSLAAESKRLAESVPGAELVALAARAFGVRYDRGASNDPRSDFVVDAIKRASAADLRAGLEAISSDQVALAGAAVLLIQQAFDSLPANERDALLPRLAEAAVVQMPFADICPLMTAVGERARDAGRLLLTRVAKGELRPPRPRWLPHPGTPTARACAVLSLAEIDPKLAEAAASGWAPADPVEQAALRGVRLMAGDESVLDAPLLGASSPAIADIVVRHLRTRPTRSALDRIVAILATDPEGPAAYRIAELMSGISGKRFLGDRRSGPEVAAGISNWWKVHRETWQAPPPPR